MNRDIFHLGVEWGIVDFKIQAISSTLKCCKFSFLMIVGSKYVFHTDNDDDVLSLKINQHTCFKLLKEELRVPWSPIAWKVVRRH